MNKKPNKKKYEVHEGETISQCLDRISKDGYTPVRRMQQPIFQEVIKNGVAETEVIGENIVFEAKLKD
ncbi:MAG: NETI motif-containing protein [Bacillaceae bacterium]|nr:NETI motif-containing protein [Bacillaceae bacterium]